jgi:hypothetical protein
MSTIKATKKAAKKAPAKKAAKKAPESVTLGEILGRYPTNRVEITVDAADLTMIADSIEELVSNTSSYGNLVSATVEIPMSNSQIVARIKFSGSWDASVTFVLKLDPDDPNYVYV